MEIHLTRQEIRRRIQARLGHVTNDGQALMVKEQIDEWIRAAAIAVYKRCTWAQTQTETTDSIGIDERFLNYPTNAGPGNIIAIGVWVEAESRYRQLRRGVIPLAADDEPLVEIGEPDSVAGRGCPQIYEPKAQLEFWPRPDMEYRLKIDHTVSPEMGDESTPSVVDGEAIILHAMAEAFDFQGDDRLANVKRAQYEEQIRALIAEQHPLTTMRRGRLDRLSVGRRVNANYIPDSGVWPSRMDP